jgi:prepilin-type N-terminal cleavage/methylation domain-containing protein
MLTLRKTSFRGFTLIEVIVSLFIFSIMMVVVSQVFASAFSGYRSTRAIQRDIDNAQYSLNIIAKELRTSSVVNPASGNLVNSSFVQFFDHSQSKCFRYRISGGNLQVASANVADVAACSGATLSTFTNITTGVINGSFRVTPSTSAPAHVGKVTVSLDISEGSTHHARIQTTVSLRDFGMSGL